VHCTRLVVLVHTSNSLSSKASGRLYHIPPQIVGTGDTPLKKSLMFSLRGTKCLIRRFDGKVKFVCDNHPIKELEKEDK
jgi:hypothetical protein